jgi:hypothetical protein
LFFDLLVIRMAAPFGVLGGCVVSGEGAAAIVPGVPQWLWVVVFVVINTVVNLAGIEISRRPARSSRPALGGAA